MLGFIGLTRLSLEFTALVVLCSCASFDSGVADLQVDVPYVIESSVVDQVPSEVVSTSVEEQRLGEDQVLSELAPFMVGDDVMDQMVGTIASSTWVELMRNDGVLLSIVELGEEPRRHLRLSPEVGQVETLSFEMAMTMGMSMGGERLVMMDTPKVSFTIESELLSIDEQGLLALRWSYTGVEVSDGVGLMEGQGDLMEAEMRGLVGLSGLQTMNSLGYPISSSMSLTDDLSPMLREQMSSVEGMLDSAAFVFPGQAVGAGASWETLREVENNGFSFVVHQVVQLNELTDTEAILSITTTQALGDTSPQIPNLPQGAEVEVTSLISSGTGQITLVEGMINGRYVETDLDMAIEMLVTGVGPEPMAMALQNQTGLKVTAVVSAE